MTLFDIIFLRNQMCGDCTQHTHVADCGHNCGITYLCPSCQQTTCGARCGVMTYYSKNSQTFLTCYCSYWCYYYWVVIHKRS